MPVDDGDDTQWLEKRLDAMDSQLSSLTGKLDNLPSGSQLPPQLAEQITALTTAVQNLSSSNQTMREELVTIREKAEKLENSLIQRQRRRNPAPASDGDGLPVPATEPVNPPTQEPTRPKRKLARI